MRCKSARSLAVCLVVLAVASPAVAGEGRWAATPEMQTKRSEVAAAILDGHLYVAGGIAQFGSTDAFEAYDLREKRWRQLAPLPEALHHAALAASGSRLILTGGYAGMGFTPDQRATFAYDPGRNQWSPLADMPGPRAAHAMVALDGMLYVVGGRGPNSEEVWRFDPTSDQWSIGPNPLQTPREHLAVAALAGRIYVVGGRDSANRSLRRVEIYDPATSGWSRTADLTRARSGFTAGVLRGRLHAAGGEDLNAGTTTATHEVFDPTKGLWLPAPPMPEARHGIASAVSDGRWFIAAGAAKAGMWSMISLRSDVFVFTPGDE